MGVYGFDWIKCNDVRRLRSWILNKNLQVLHKCQNTFKQSPLLREQLCFRNSVILRFAISLLILNRKNLVSTH